MIFFQFKHAKCWLLSCKFFAKVKDLDLKKYFEDNKSCLVGTSLNGDSIYDLKKPIKKGVIVFGNESHGVSSKLQEMMNIKIKIPKYNKSMYPESLNLATSVGIVLSKLMKISWINEILDL